MKHIVALSGGKDSTAMALRLAELEPRDYEYVCTPTGNEPPDMVEHWVRLGELLGKRLTPISSGKSLSALIHEQHAVPNWRMRWCTRILKIEPFQAYVLKSLPCTLYVGLRADETDREGAEYGAGLFVTTDFPLRRWGWGIQRVKGYLEERGVKIPERTDCMGCFFQTLYEWWALWKFRPESYAECEEWETFTGHTLRSAQRDTHPAALKDLRAEFEGGYQPAVRKMADRPMMCSVCAR